MRHGFRNGFTLDPSRDDLASSLLNPMWDATFLFFTHRVCILDKTHTKYCSKKSILDVIGQKITNFKVVPWKTAAKRT